MKANKGLFPIPEGVFRLAVDVRVDVDEIKTWDVERIRAFFYGLSLLLQAQNDTL